MNIPTAIIAAIPGMASKGFTTPIDNTVWFKWGAPEKTYRAKQSGSFIEIEEATWNGKEYQYQRTDISKLMEVLVGRVGVRLGWDEPFESEQKANARLIAAAPELLDAAKAVLRWVPKNVERVDGAPSSRDRLVSAIAKAEGRTT